MSDYSNFKNPPPPDSVAKDNSGTQRQIGRREAASPDGEQRPAGKGQAHTAQGAQKDSIALGLRRLWAGVEQEVVPDDFMRLLDEIDSHRGHGGNGSGGGDHSGGAHGGSL